MMPTRKRDMSVQWLLSCLLVFVSIVACAGERWPTVWHDTLGWAGTLKTHWSGTFDVRNDHGDKMVVDSCKTAFQADAKGMKDSVVRDFYIYRSWVADCYAARAFSGASAAQHSFVADFVMDPQHVKALPVDLAFAISNDEVRKMARIKANGGNLGDYYIHGATVDAGKSAHPLGAVIDDSSGGHQGLSLLAQGDFDHDGIEDLLIATYSTVTGGSYQYYGLFVVTRTVAHAPMKVIETFPVMGPGID